MFVFFNNIYLLLVTLLLLSLSAKEIVIEKDRIANVITFFQLSVL